MLQRLRSRHAIDLPFGGFGFKKGIFLILGGIAGLFVLMPLGLSPLAALSESVLRTVIAVGAGFGALVLVLVVAGIRGKYGWQR